MCGISGWFCWGDRRPKPATIRGLLLANMERGTSATGMAYLDADGNIMVRKGKGPADKFIENTTAEEFDVAAKSPRGLLHARATTKGSEDKNENNHPVVMGGWSVVHNGSVSNDEDLWGYYIDKESVTRPAEVDTAAIPLMLSRGDTVEESIKKLSALGGSMTIAAWNEKDKERLILGRFGHNDLHMFYDAAANILYWSSAPSAAYVMRGVLMGKHKFLTLSRLADDHVLLLSPEGLDSTRVFKVTRRPFHAARKGVGRSTSTGTDASGKPGGGNTFTPVSRSAESSAQTFLALPPSRAEREALSHSSRTSGVVSPPASTTGWKEITGRDQIRHQVAGRDYIKVMFPVPNDALMLCASWKPVDTELTKPSPTSDIFTKVWWSLEGIIKTIKQDTLITHCTKQTAYGRWTIGYDRAKHEVELNFKGHKRVKSWWDRLYRMKFEFPLTLDDMGGSELDDHLAWEHYDIMLQKSDKSTHSFLGFMCPWCGVWLSSTNVQAMKYRCEFCCVRSRTQPATGGKKDG